MKKRHAMHAFFSKTDRNPPGGGEVLKICHHAVLMGPRGGIPEDGGDSE